MPKFLICAIREFSATALTRAFLFGAVIFPISIWGVMILVSAMKFERPALQGTLVVIDKSKDAKIADALTKYYDADFQKAKAALEMQTLDQIRQTAGSGASRAVSMAADLSGLGAPANVKVEVLGADADVAAQRKRARDFEVLAVVTIDESTLELNPMALLEAQKRRFTNAATIDEEKEKETVSAGSAASGAGPSDAAPAVAPPSGSAGAADPAKAASSVPGSFEFVQGTKLRPDHADSLRAAIADVVKDERYRRANVDPIMAKLLQQLPVVDRSIVVTDKGEKESNEGLTRILPLLFLMLIYIAAVTGGQYLMMGTLEEKSSRVMEVMLSACSARDLMLGKLLGQGLVGLTVLSIYAGLGLGAAGRFGVGAQIPSNILPWMIFYFLLAYCFIGALMLAVGSAVTEIREAQALYTPITIVIVMPFILMVPIMQNPGSMLSHIFSHFPPTTPYVMVMRMSQPSHVIPVWELISTSLVGTLGVVFTVWAAAKIFRVGALMYGKPPSLMGLLKWIRYA